MLLQEKTRLNKLSILVPLFILAFMFLLGTMYFFPSAVVMADTDVTEDAVFNRHARQVLKAVFVIIQLIGAVVGVMLIVQGGMRYAIAHGNDNGPEQTKAITTLAAGVCVVLFALVVIPSVDFPKLIVDITNKNKYEIVTGNDWGG